ncbi:hypothetical protein GCM10015536_65500 [Streptomyces griseomycini]|nr:hypothetical protein GCM10015536_65500 [Streptomyces griseomycini]
MRLVRLVRVGDVRRTWGHESWPERDPLVPFGFDPPVTGTTSQPFRLSWDGPEDAA